MDETTITSGVNTSYWIDNLTAPMSYSKLFEDTNTDVVIVGGGIAGLSIAYRLTQLKKKVILVDDGYIGSGETGRTIKEVIGGMAAYLKEKPKNADRVKISEIKTGEGKIIEMEGQKYGAYVDEENNLHLVKAECTHLKCIVNWNNDEKSWDCPCHGSRFSHTGKVMNGPANTDLFYFQEINNPQAITNNDKIKVHQ